MMDKQVAVIVAAYNVEKYIERCIYSLKSQTYTKWIAYVVNDGSSDGTEEKLKKISSQDKRVVFKTIGNKGVFQARKIAIDMVRSCKYLMFLDSDDYLCDKYLLEKAIRKMEEERIDIVAFNYIKGGKTGFKERKEIRVNSNEEMIGHMLSRDIIDGNMPYSIYRFDIVKNNYRIRDYNNDDFLNKYAFLEASKNLIFMPWIGYYYDTNPDSQTQRDIREEDIAYYNHTKSFCEKVVRKYPGIRKEATYFKCWVLLWMATNLSKNRTFRKLEIYKEIIALTDHNWKNFLKNSYFSWKERFEWLLVRTRTYNLVYRMYSFYK